MNVSETSSMSVLGIWRQPSRIKASGSTLMPPVSGNRVRWLACPTRRLDVDAARSSSFGRSEMAVGMVHGTFPLSLFAEAPEGAGARGAPPSPACLPTGIGGGEGELDPGDLGGREAPPALQPSRTRIPSVSSKAPR